MRSDRRPAREPQGVDGFTTLLRQAGVDFGVEDLADALWLAQFVESPGPEEDLQQDDVDQEQSGPNVREEYLELEEDLDEDPAQLSLPSTQGQTQEGNQKPESIPIKAPAASALRIRLDLSRALRPLRRQVASPGRRVFDEEATVEQIANQQIWSPMMKPAPERWLDVALVVEETQTLSVWKETITEVQTLLERQGAFRRVTTWRLKEDKGKLALFQHWQRPGKRSRQAKDLWEPTGRRLIMLLSDCSSDAWHDGRMVSWLQTWGQKAPTVVIQLLPERLWSQTVLGMGVPVRFSAIEPGCINERLATAYRLPIYKQILAGVEADNRVKVPVVPLQAEPLKQWAKVVAGNGENWTPGIVFNASTESKPGNSLSGVETLDATEKVQRFRMTASLIAQELAGLMSVAPVSPPIVDLIRQTLLPKAEPVHVAEVYMGGLMESSQGAASGEATYDFDDEVRRQLADTVPRSVSKRVLNAVSAYIAERLNLNTRSFEALLSFDFEGDAEAEGMVVPFARVAEQTLRRMGWEYAAIADRIRTQPKVLLPSIERNPGDWIPLLQTFTFQEATVVFTAKAKTAVKIEPAKKKSGHKNHSTVGPTKPLLPTTYSTTALDSRLQAARTYFNVENQNLYIELFCGAAEIPFNLGIRNCMLHDNNPHIINFYKWVQRGDFLRNGWLIERKTGRHTWAKNRSRFNELINSGQSKTLEAAQLTFYLSNTSTKFALGISAANHSNFMGLYALPERELPQIDWEATALAIYNWEFVHLSNYSELVVPEEAYLVVNAPTVYKMQWDGHSWTEADHEELRIWLNNLPNSVLIFHPKRSSISRIYSVLNDNLNVKNKKIFKVLPR